MIESMSNHHSSSRIFFTLPQRILSGLIIYLSSSCALVTYAQGTSASPTAGITTITLERSCFGCASSSLLVLHRSGLTSITETGNARHGTPGKISSGTISPVEFEHLARLAIASGFFALNDTYEDPQIRDGAWSTTTITRNGQDKKVFRREDAGPASLTALEAGIDAAKARIGFYP